MSDIPGFVMPDYIRTYSGARFHVPHPAAGDIWLADIVHGLSIAPRWGGQSKYRYPVLAHSIYVAEMLPDPYKFDGLMHDASEAFLCDVPSPMKRLLPQYKELEHGIMVAIAEKFHFSWPPPELVKVADAVALYDERVALFDLDPGDDVPVITDHTGLSEPTIWDFKSWSEMTLPQLKQAFLAYYDYCQKVRV